MSTHSTLRHQPQRRCVLVLACCVGTLMLASIALAQSTGGPYTMNPQSIDNGGGRSTGGIYALEGTIGQHDASNVQSGGSFELTGGFQRRGAAASGDAIFSNGFEGP